MPLGTLSRLTSIIDIPVSLPTTKIAPQDYVVVSVAQIFQPMRLTVRWLSLTAWKVYATAGVTPLEASAGLGLAYLGLYRASPTGAGFNYNISPTGQPAIEPSLPITSLTVLPVTAQRSTIPNAYSTPGTYLAVVYNNSNVTLDLTVTGQLRIDTNPPA